MMPCEGFVLHISTRTCTQDVRDRPTDRHAGRLSGRQIDRYMYR